MKRKIHKILGVTLTLVMVLTLAVAFSAPAMAAEEEWDLFDVPAAGATDDYFMDDTISSVGPIARAINGDLYVATDPVGACSQETAELVDFEEGGTDGTATWSIEYAHHGSYSAKLDSKTVDVTKPVPFAVRVPYGEPLDTITNADFTYWYSKTDDPGSFGVLYIDSEGGDTVDKALISTVAAPNVTDGTWTETAQYDWWHEYPCTGELVVGAGTGTWNTLANWQAEHLDATLLHVAAGWGTVADVTIYIDDITIGDTTWNLEIGAAGDVAADGLAYGLRTCLMLSDDDGRSWEETDYLTDTGGGTIVDIACSSEDADVLYVATAQHVYKTEDAGDEWSEVGGANIAAVPGAITSIDVGYSDDKPYVFIGTATGDYGGGVYYKEDFSFGRVWTDLKVDDGAVNADLDVYAVNCSPNFDEDTEVDVLVTDAIYTAVVSNTGSVIGDWEEVAELLEDDEISFGSIAASDICYPEDLDDEYEMFVGVVGAITVGGDVYRVGDGTAYDLGVDDDIVSLDLVGDWGATSLVAGAIDLVYYSTDDGDSWDETDKAPTGTDATGNFVVVDDDFADSGIAWCASDATTEGGVHLTTDFGATWNGISLLDTNMGGSVNDIAFAPGYGEDDAPMFMVTQSDVADTDDSVWKFDGTNWERVWLDTANELDLVEVSPSYADDTAVFVADSADPVILYSHDGGAEFTKMTQQPGAAITAWVVIDDETIITGAADGVLYKTARYGRRAWDEPTVPSAAGDITDIAVSGDAVLVGDNASQVFISFDEGDEFEEVSGSDVAGLTTPDNNTYVAFDTRYADNNFIYAASGDVVARCEIDTEEDMGDLEFDDIGDTLSTGFNNASAIVVSDDGKQAGEDVATLYVASRDAAEDGKDGIWGTGDDVGGVHRCLNPTDDLADIVFEVPNYGFAANITFGGLAEAATVGNLELTSGSNILYAIDTHADATAPENIYTYEDTLAAPVVLTSPAAGAGLDSTSTVQFKWKDLNADTVAQYQIWVNEEDDFPSATDMEVGTVDTDSSDLHDDNELTWRDEAEAGTEYFWKVRVATGQPVLSRWSDARSFTTKVSEVGSPVEVRPLPGAQDIILTPSFSWEAVAGADIYEIEIATDAGFTSVVTSASALINAWALDVELDYSTVYYWRVRGTSASGAPAGDWVISVFTTMAKPEKAPAPVTVTEVPAPDVTVTVPVTEITPAWIWAIVAIGAVLCIAVIILIVRTRRVV